MYGLTECCLQFIVVSIEHTCTCACSVHSQFTYMYAHLGCCQSLTHVTINCTYFKHALHAPFYHQLLDDYALVRPTVVASTPRFWSMLYNKYLQALQSAYRQYMSLSPEEREKEFEEKVEGVKEKKMQEVVRGEKEVASGEEEAVRSEEEVVRGEEGEVKINEEGKRGMSSEREEVEKVEGGGGGGGGGGGLKRKIRSWRTR